MKLNNIGLCFREVKINGIVSDSFSRQPQGDIFDICVSGEPKVRVITSSWGVGLHMYLPNGVVRSGAFDYKDAHLLTPTKVAQMVSQYLRKRNTSLGNDKQLMDYLQIFESDPYSENLV